MTCDVTVTDTLAESYPLATSTTAGAATEGKADRKDLIYQSLAHTHTFIPLAFETFGPINSKGYRFFLTYLADVFQLALAVCGKLLFYFNIYR